MSATCNKFEEYEVRPLFQVARAAMSDPERSRDPLTQAGLVLLMDIIEERMYPPAERKPRRRRNA